jgi:WD40 repeat protein
MSFDLFISYSHRADRRLAPVLKSAVQRVAKPFYKLRARRVYLDQTNLESNPEVWPSIERALLASRYFLLLCSPEAAASRWVAREIACWLEHKDPSHLLIAWTAGELEWDVDARDFDWSRTTAVPRALQGVFGDTPLWLDFRAFASARAETPTATQLFDTVAPLAARLDGVDLDLIISEDARQHRRFRRAATAVGAALLVLAVAATWFAMSFLAQRDEAVRRLIKLNTGNGIQLLDQNDYPGAAVWFTEALKLTAPDAQRDARIRLAALLSAYPRVRQVLVGDAPIVLAHYSADGRRIVAVHADRTIRVWDAESGAAITPPMAHKGSVSSAAFSPNGRQILSVSLGKSLDLDDPSRRGRDPQADAAEKLLESLPEDEEALKKLDPLMADEEKMTAFLQQLQLADVDEAERMLEQHPYFKALWQAMSPMLDGGYFQLWDADTGRPLSKRLKDDFALDTAIFAPDASRILIRGGGARVWNIDAKRGFSRGEQSVGYSVLDAAISPDGSRYALGGYGSHAGVFDTASGAQLFTVEASPGSNGEVEQVAFSHDGSLLATGDRYGRVRLWRAATGEAVSPFLELTTDISVLAFSPDDRLLLAGTGSVSAGAFQLWETKSGKHVTARQRVRFPITAASFSPDGTRIVMSTREYGSGRAETFVWETPELDTWTPTALVRSLAPPLLDADFAAWHPDSHRILTVGPLGIVRTWIVDVGDFAPAASLREYAPVIDNLRKDQTEAISPDGKLRAIGTGENNQLDREGEVKVVDAATGQPVTPVIKQRFFPHHLEFSRDGARLLTVCHDHNWDNGSARVWNARTGEPIGPELTHDHVVGSAGFDPSGRRVVTASPSGAIIVWDAATGKELGPRINHPSASQVMFSADGALILSRGGPDEYENVRVWDARTRQPRTPAMVHPGMFGAAFSPDGRFILTIGGDRARVWLAETGEPLSPFIPSGAAQWHRHDLKLLLNPVDRFEVYKTPWSQTHRTPMVWNFTPAQQATETLGLLAEFLAGRRVDQAGALTGMDRTSLAQTWAALNVRR